MKDLHIYENVKMGKCNCLILFWYPNSGWNLDNSGRNSDISKKVKFILEKNWFVITISFNWMKK